MTFHSRTLARFWERYDELPEKVQRQADKQYALFSQDPFHPSLRLKPVGPFWSVSISRSHRALAVREDDIFVWFWIGTHDQYERMIG